MLGFGGLPSFFCDLEIKVKHIEGEGGVKRQGVERDQQHRGRQYLLVCLKGQGFVGKNGERLPLPVTPKCDRTHVAHISKWDRWREREKERVTMQLWKGREKHVSMEASHWPIGNHDRWKGSVGCYSNQEPHGTHFCCNVQTHTYWTKVSMQEYKQHLRNALLFFLHMALHSSFCYGELSSHQILALLSLCCNITVISLLNEDSSGVFFIINTPTGSLICNHNWMLHDQIPR